jgi:hypothetical protein
MGGHNAPTMAAEMMGSVGVRQAEMARHEMKLRLGMSAFKMPAQV